MKKWIDKDPYMHAYTRRIIWFAWISGIYIVSYFVFLIVSLFIEIDWNFTEPLLAYCVYSIWFNAYNYYRFRQNSLESEKRRNELYADLEKTLDFIIEKDYPEFTPFNFKKSRKHVLAIYVVAIVINVMLIVFNGGSYWWL